MIGKQIGNYKIKEKLGGGGMGVVYKAQDMRLKRTVALKFLPPQYSTDSESKKRFEHEAQSASALDHPNICTIYEIGETEDGQSYIAMACYDGQSLKDMIGTTGSVALSVDQTISIIIQIAKGLARAHEESIVHRDIKPANIMLTDRGEVKIVDFGLAKLAGQTKLTKNGTTLGTVTYMSPEQARGNEVDARTDIWALGVILYEMLTGRAPFSGEYDQAVIYSIINEEPESVTKLHSDVPPALGQIVSRALEKDPNRRYQGMKELLDDLEAFTAGIVPEEIQARMRKALLRKRWKKILYGLAAAVLTVVVAVLVLVNRQAQAIDSIAVLPLKNLTGDAEQEYFVDSVTDELIGALGRISGLRRVISRTSVMRYKDTRKSLQEIARELNVDALVEGTVYQVGENISLRVQLFDALPEERSLWTQRYERPITGVLVMYGEMAGAIAENIRITLTVEETTRLAGIRQVNPESYDAYLKGKFHHYKATLNDLNTAMLYYELAIEKDPDFALAYAGIAGIWLWRQQLHLASSDEAGPKIMEAIERALELDRTLAEAHQQLASMHVWGRFDWKAGEEAFKKAITINPNYVEAHAYYSHLLRILGRAEEATEHIELALKLDPHSLLLKIFYSQDLLSRYKYEECISICREVLEKNPTTLLTASTLYEALYLTGRYEEAFEFIKLEYSKNDLLKDFDHVFDHYEKLGFAGTLHLEADTLQAQAKSKYLPPGALIDLYIMAGNKERALDCLEQAYEMRDPWIPYISTVPLFDSLRNELRFQDILRRMNLPIELRVDR